MLEALKSLLNVHYLVSAFGYPGLFAIIFAETGLFLGFFLPGDSLLLTAGIFASKGDLNIYVLLVVLATAAILGNTVGYLFGSKLGKKLFSKEDSLLFRKQHLIHARSFYEKHGGKAIILARFIPVVRTFAPIVAGIGDMEFKTFMLYNIVGSILWAIGITLLGFFVGKLIPDKLFEPIVILVIILSLSPAIYEAFKSKERRAKMLLMFSRKK
ncbi:MAG TPA: VTT domain-containing protein [Candidatus Saccharimonadales bacterium]|nr:VTT domain-containing protein [Candidatus Saccharimonadales bacterium]